MTSNATVLYQTEIYWGVTGWLMITIPKYWPAAVLLSHKWTYLHRHPDRASSVIFSQINILGLCRTVNYRLRINTTGRRSLIGVWGSWGIGWRDPVESIAIAMHVPRWLQFATGDEWLVPVCRRKRLSVAGVVSESRATDWPSTHTWSTADVILATPVDSSTSS
jgi:hypothetical protein